MNPVAVLVAALMVLSTIFAAVLLSVYGLKAFELALEIYYGKVKELEEKLEKSQLQEQRGAENYQTLGEMYDRLADKYREQSATVEQQADLIKSLRNKEQGQGLVEYMLAIVGIALAVIVLAWLLGWRVDAMYTRFVEAVPWP